MLMSFRLLARACRSVLGKCEQRQSALETYVPLSAPGPLCFGYLGSVWRMLTYPERGRAAGWHRGLFAEACCNPRIPRQPSRNSRISEGDSQGTFHRDISPIGITRLLSQLQKRKKLVSIGTCIIIAERRGAQRWIESEPKLRFGLLFVFGSA